MHSFWTHAPQVCRRGVLGMRYPRPLGWFLQLRHARHCNPVADRFNRGMGHVRGVCSPSLYSINYTALCSQKRHPGTGDAIHPRFRSRRVLRRCYVLSTKFHRDCQADAAVRRRDAAERLSGGAGPTLLVGNPVHIMNLHFNLLSIDKHTCSLSISYSLYTFNHALHSSGMGWCGSACLTTTLCNTFCMSLPWIMEVCARRV